MLNPATSAQTRQSAHALLAAGGVPVSVINDSPGFVAQRVVAHIVNVGCDIAQMRIATPEDLDRAVMLGLGYPKGPLAMGDALGAKRIFNVLQNMHELYQEPRYRPSPWLRRRAMRISLTGQRITMPASVTSMIWSLCPTGKTATTASWRRVRSMLLMP